MCPESNSFERFLFSSSSFLFSSLSSAAKRQDRDRGSGQLTDNEDPLSDKPVFVCERRWSGVLQLIDFGYVWNGLRTACGRAEIP